MTRIKYNFIILFLIGIQYSSACNCPVFKNLAAIQQSELNNSQCIFVGKVLEINKKKNTFKVEVIESFTETNSGTVYEGIYDEQCGPIINELGTWLFYGNFFGLRYLTVNSCGLTRSFKNPDFNIMACKEMPKKEQNESESHWKRKWNKIAIRSLGEELKNLRKIKK